MVSDDCERDHPGELTMQAVQSNGEASPVRVEREGHTVRVTLDRASKANALTAGMMFALASAFREARRGEVIVLQSASSRLFCAGADIGEFLAGPEALARQEEGLLAFIRAMAEVEAPIVAVVRGRAAGAGAILLALADVVIAAEDLQITAPEFAFGMYPIIVEAVLQSRLWPALVSRLCTGVGTIGAAEALALGLINDLVPLEAFEPTAAARVGYYLEREPALQALRGSRRASAATQTMLRQLDAVAPMMVANFEAHGVRERISAYVDGLRKR